MNDISVKYKLYRSYCFNASREITKIYSTSFYSATGLFPPHIKQAIYNIYGFVRMADEIVDSFHENNKEQLLLAFEQDYYRAYQEGISSNPILHSFQLTVKQYDIPDEYIQAFLTSMKSDLKKKEYKTEEEIKAYIYGSADVVGLMCLKIFCDGDASLFESLKQPAMSLGSAFQKVNFLRDLREDYALLGRLYFPNLSVSELNEETKNLIVQDIEKDFLNAYEGIKKLPKETRQAVLTAYNYYLDLLRTIKKTPSAKLLSKRVRVPDFKKLLILLSSAIKNSLNVL